MANTRWHSLDALRVLAFGLLILYHIGMAYVVDWDWHIKSAHQSAVLQNVMLWANQWRMSLLFLISGAAVAFMLQKQSSMGFMRGRLIYVAMPLLFGVAVVVVPQVYVELKQQALIQDMGYFEFWRRYLLGGWFMSEGLPHAYGRLEPTLLTWNHLWFLAYIFCYSIITCFLYRLAIKSCAFRNLVMMALKLPALLILLLPIGWLWFSGWWLWERFPPNYGLFSDWYNHARYGIAFIFGFTYVRSITFKAALIVSRWGLLFAAMVTCAGIFYLFHGGTMSWPQLDGLIWSANAWLWMLTVLAWAEHVFNNSNRLISALNRRVYCFYILHQTMLILVLYSLQPMQLSMGLEFFMVLIFTILLCSIGYELVCKVPYLRLFFGVFKY